MPSYAETLTQPAWWLVDEQRKVVASIRATTAAAAREQFKDAGLSGVRVIRAEVAPVVEPAEAPGAKCEGCKRLINEATDYRRVTGYERISRNGAGGTHAIRAPDRSSERFLCMFCIDKLANGVAFGQETLAV